MASVSAQPWLPESGPSSHTAVDEKRGLQSPLAELTAVNVAPVTKGDHDHEQDVVPDGVDDPVVADPDPESVPSLQLPRVWRARVFRQQRDRSLDSAPVLPVDLAQGTKGSRAQFDPVTAQRRSQPRSALA